MPVQPRSAIRLPTTGRDEYYPPPQPHDFFFFPVWTLAAENVKHRLVLRSTNFVSNGNIMEYHFKCSENTF